MSTNNITISRTEYESLSQSIKQLQKTIAEGASAVKDNVPEPETFNGTDRTLFQPFLNQIKLIFKVKPYNFTTDRSKVLYLLTHLRGTAADWVEPYLREDNQEDPDNVLNNFSKFEKDLNLMFGDRNQTRTAARALRRLEQTTSVVAYTTEFHRLCTKTTWNESACIDQYLEGLRDNVKRNMVGLSEPTTLTGWINLAITVDDHIQECIINNRSKYNNNINNRNTYRRNQGNWAMNPSISE